MAEIDIVEEMKPRNQVGDRRWAQYKQVMEF